MPYLTPKKKGRKGESNFALAVKIIFYLYKFEHPRLRIKLTEFCRDFEKIVKENQYLEVLHDDYGIEWDFYNEDDTLRCPKYDTLKSKWRPNYFWDEEYPQFKSDRLAMTDDSELEKYIRQKAYLNRKDSEAIKTCYEKEEEYKRVEKEKGKDMTYPRNKNQESISIIEERWRKRLGYNDKVKFEGEINSKVTVNEPKDFFKDKKAYAPQDVKDLLFKDEGVDK